MKNNINVVITGENEQSKELVGAIIKEALDSNGFNNVTAVNSVGEPTVTPKSSSLFDAIQAVNPNLFHEPVRIWTNGYAAEVSSDEAVSAVETTPIDDPQFVNDAVEAEQT